MKTREGERHDLASSKDVMESAQDEANFSNKCLVMGVLLIVTNRQKNRTNSH